MSLFGLSSCMLYLECSPDRLAEKTWTLEVLFGVCLGVHVRVQPVEGFDGYRLVLPNGSQLFWEDHFFKHLTSAFPAPGFLPQNVFFSEKTQITGIYGRDVVEKNAQQLHCGIDLTASAFFMLSRWEEHLPGKRDSHGRFPAQASVAWKHGFLNRPVVDEYAALLKRWLLELGYTGPFANHRFTVVPTHDVDYPRLWWKPWDRFRTLAGSFKRKNPLQELRWWLRQSNDPFDTFDELMDLSERNNLVSQFNFMGKRASTSDAWYPLDAPWIHALIGRIRLRGHIIGFHPSYEAYENEALFEAELQSVREAAGMPVVSGRQHFLRFAVPDTWQRWERMGMHTDSSMGYPEMPGFRCGICRPFPVFDVLQRKKLNLTEQPLLFMDVSLALYQKLPAEEALQQAVALRAQVEKHGGEWVVLWHNSSWNTPFWEPWKVVYQNIVAT